MLMTSTDRDTYSRLFLQLVYQSHCPEALADNERGAAVRLWHWFQVRRYFYERALVLETSFLRLSRALDLCGEVSLTAWNEGLQALLRTIGLEVQGQEDGSVVDPFCAPGQPFDSLLPGAFEVSWGNVRFRVHPAETWGDPSQRTIEVETMPDVDHCLSPGWNRERLWTVSGTWAEDTTPSLCRRIMTMDDRYGEIFKTIAVAGESFVPLADNERGAAARLWYWFQVRHYLRSRARTFENRYRDLAREFGPDEERLCYWENALMNHFALIGVDLVRHKGGKDLDPFFDPDPDAYELDSPVTREITIAWGNVRFRFGTQLDRESRRPIEIATVDTVDHIVNF